MTKTIRLTGQTRAMTLNGELTGEIYNEGGAWWPDFLEKLRLLGFRVDDVSSVDLATPAQALARALCHAHESGLESDPETAEKVAVWLLKHYELEPVK